MEEDVFNEDEEFEMVKPTPEEKVVKSVPKAAT